MNIRQLNGKQDAGEQFKAILNKLETIETAKTDAFVTPDMLRFTNEGRLQIQGIADQVGFTQNGLQQFCNRFGMPVRYAEKCIEHSPKMFADHMQEWIKQSDDKNMLFRMYQTTDKTRVRAVLSERYGIMDNLPILSKIGEELPEYNGKITNFNVTSDFFDLRVTFPDQKRVIGKLNDGITDDIIFPAYHVRNSETGRATLIVTMAIFRLVCSNGMVRMEEGKSLKKRHIGSMEIDINSRINSVIGDMTKDFDSLVQAHMEAKNDRIDIEAELMKLGGARFKLNEKQLEEIGRSYRQERGNSRHHLIQAITATARDTKDWSERMELEKLGFELLTA